MTTRRWLMSVLVAAAVLLIVGRSLAGVYSDYLWYEALGAGALWRVRMGSVAAMRIGSGVVAALFAFLNLFAVRQSVVSLVLPRRLGNLDLMFVFASIEPAFRPVHPEGRVFAVATLHLRKPEPSRPLTFKGLAPKLLRMISRRRVAK